MGEKPVVVQFLGINFNLTNCISGLIAALFVFVLVYYLSRKIELRPNKKTKRARIPGGFH